MYAILETGGKQYRVEAGATLQIEALDAEEGQTVELNLCGLFRTTMEKLLGNPRSTKPISKQSS